MLSSVSHHTAFISVMLTNPSPLYPYNFFYITTLLARSLDNHPRSTTQPQPDRLSSQEMSRNTLLTPTIRTFINGSILTSYAPLLMRPTTHTPSAPIQYRPSPIHRCVGHFDLSTGPHHVILVHGMAHHPRTTYYSDTNSSSQCASRCMVHISAQLDPSVWHVHVTITKLHLRLSAAGAATNILPQETLPPRHDGQVHF